MLPVLLALLLAASAGRPAAAGTTTVDLYRNNAVLDNLGGKERPAKNVAVRFFLLELVRGYGGNGRVSPFYLSRPAHTHRGEPVYACESRPGHQA